MKCYFWGEDVALNGHSTDIESVEAIFEKIATGTDTRDLVVSCYFLSRSRWYGGSAYVRNWILPNEFSTSRGKWRFTRYFPRPDDLPARFKLIRLLVVQNLLTNHFPLKLKDGYGWEFEYQNEESYLALLFAHELHHFRRYHLGLHPGEGEKSANRWALKHVQQLGFPVSGRVRKQPGRKRLKPSKRFFWHDQYAEFRTLVAGNQVYIRHDPRGKYSSKIATVLRPIRSNSKRIAIQTDDKKAWLWPMEWLDAINFPPKP